MICKLLSDPLKFPDMFERDLELSWKPRPSNTISGRTTGNIEYSINSQGLRGDEITPKPGNIRIAAIGSSETFGWGIPESEIYLRVLEKMIDDDSSLCEVEMINAGIPGHSSFQGKRFFVSEISKLKPDIIIIMFGWSDQQAAMDNAPDKEVVSPSKRIIRLQNILSRIRLYQILAGFIDNLGEPESEAGDSVSRVSYTDFYDNLSVIIYSARAEGMTPILLTTPVPLPDKYDFPADYKDVYRRHQYYNMQIRLLARNSQTALVDLAAEFDKQAGLYDNPVNNPMLFNAQGHQLAAKTIYEFFRSHRNMLVRK